jgi:hypothetical protein
MAILPLVTRFSGWQAVSCEYASLTSAMIIGGVLIVGAVVFVVRRSPPSH